MLFHELREIHYRYLGYNVKEAHFKARIDEALKFCNDPKWVEYFEKFPDNIVPLRCLKKLCNVIERNIKVANILYQLLTNCVKHHKQYD